MEKQKRWQFYLILAVIVLTLYNILPTIFFYTKPLSQSVDEPMAKEIALDINSRVNALEIDAKDWLNSFCKLLGIKPISIEMQASGPGLIDIEFKTSNDAALFKRFLPRAGALITFMPSQLELENASTENKSEKVTVMRRIDVHLNQKDMDHLYQFTSRYEANGNPSAFYRELVYDRLTQLALALGGQSKTAFQLNALFQSSSDPSYDEAVISIAKEIEEMNQALSKNPTILKRYFSVFAQTSASDPNALIQKYLVKSETLKTKLSAELDAILNEQKQLKEKGQVLTSPKQQQLANLENQKSSLETANAILRKNLEDFKKPSSPLTVASIQTNLSQNSVLASEKESVETINLSGHNPFVEALVVDWNNDQIMIKFYDDIQKIRLNEEKTEVNAYLKEQLNQFVINDIARASRLSDETISPDGDNFVVHLNKLSNTSGVLAFNLGYLAEIQSRKITENLTREWSPKHEDLTSQVYPINDYKDYKALKSEDQKLGLVVYAPSMYKEAPITGFRSGSIYVIAKGLDSIIQKYRQAPGDTTSQLLMEDVNRLTSLLQQKGFIGYPGKTFGMAPEFSKDYIFELDDYYSNLIKATREDFTVHGSKRFAVLDFSDVEQRILTWNKIQDKIQEDLLKWKEEYNAAQVDINLTSHYQVPYPTKNVYWENFKLSFLKYFKGDDRKVLKWGLDLSGGKTVRIGLSDQNGKRVTDPNDLKQAVNELYERVNKMGVSERTIRIEDSHIILDFPGSQNLSAAELVKASAMYFHIVNEKFTPNNSELKEAINQFLQNVWNEAVVTNRKDIDSINDIAWQHLGAENDNQDTRPRSEYAKILYDNGLKLANPKQKMMGRTYNDTLSSIGMIRGEDLAEWDGQPHPLIVVFHNYALDGSNLTNIQAGYDSSEGNILTFSVKRSYEGVDKGSGNPRDDFYAWTSQFSEDKIAGTPKEAYSRGHGWRMAVILNGQIISKPMLKAALKDGATISGRFSQREVNQLAADLKAGSLSFTPRILSEQNVSPELGKEERQKGIIASLVALALVITAMIGYYRFAGFVAVCAVLFNILIMWGVLQNLDAAMTLPGIAGIVLVIGMAVDANVLVFERVREEFKLSGRIASALQTGYRKAFSAIVDSNITTIIAALILIQFDSGPIKGFAVTLIIGILSSMFTALFMTRYFFAGWVQNPKNKFLTMSQFIGQTHIDFLAQTKKAIVISLAVMLVGGLLFFTQFKTMFGMDFTGGYSAVVELQEKPDVSSYRLTASDALMANGATLNDFQIRELSRPNQLRIQFSTSMEEKGHPFYQMPENNPEGKYTYLYQSNPRLVWLVNSLNNGNLQIQPSQLDTIDQDWSVMSGQFSDAMRYNAVIGLAFALISILLYITLRFEFKFAVAAVIGLVHDVIITLGILALFHKLGFAVQIDLQVVGAIMTIIGYSLNDTIIVFDRIREDIKIFRKMKFHDIVNHALNVTLSRTIMTSGTTLIVLLALVLLGGKSIFSFSLVMTIGVIVGTLSSLYIASPVVIYLHDREERQKEELIRLKKTS
jgi:SecD/SecF fusion protein